MALVPFVYFTLLTFYWWKKHQCIDICVYMSALYSFSSACTIVIIAFDLLGKGGILFDSSDLELNLVSTVIYCALLTLSMLPFSMLYVKDIKRITNTHKFIVPLLGWFLIFISFIVIYLVADSTMEILQGDLSSVRADHYNGLETPAQVKAESMSLIFRYSYLFTASTVLALPLFFYSICFEKRKWWFNGLLVVASLTSIMNGIQVADRTEVVYFALMLIYCLLFFRKFFTKKLKRRLVLVISPVIILGIIYFGMVSISRFSERKGGTGAGLAQYAGQGYLNFCFFWENEKSNQIFPEREFPLIWHVLFDIDNTPERRSDKAEAQGFNTSIFGTFIGDIMLDLTPLGTILWLSYFFIICCVVIKTSHREEYDIGDMLAIFSLSAIPLFGVFYYRYYHFTSTIMLFIVIFVYIISKFKFKFSTNEDNNNNSNLQCDAQQLDSQMSQ